MAKMAKGEMLQMTQRDIDRVKVLHQAIQRRITQEKAGELLALSREWVNRLCQRIKQNGDRAVIHGLRGKPSNHQLPAGLIDKAIGKIKKKYIGFGPTLAAEKLLELDKITLSVETIRQSMISAHLWEDKERRATHREWRERKECFGEMTQMDGSDHDWFESRGAKCILLASIDDATNRIFLRFTEHEDTRNLMLFSREYLKRFGRPRIFYVDKDSIYVTNRKPSLEEELQGRKYALTQFTRAAEVDLGIKVINAGSPQAKGRVERLFQTLQDRLVKELRLAGVSTIQAANRFLDQAYLAKHNGKFSLEPKNKTDMHQPVRKSEAELDAIFSFHEARVLCNDYTIHWKNRLFQVEKRQPYFLLPRTKVIVEERLNGLVKIKYKGKYLKMHEIEHQRIRLPRSAPPLPVKLDKPKPQLSHIPPKNHPWRQSFAAWKRIALERKAKALV
ncbi:ISNCY family transposase [Patescibacteria group bacterium]|nr:ISNCY family transposase [Patescibacteria group bacterium]